MIWNALAMQYRLGYQASSDHISTHISYAFAIAEKPTREAIFDAFRRRHCYAATDNILLDVRAGEHLMGDEFTARGPVRLKVLAQGTGPIKRVDVIKDFVYLYTAEPKTDRVAFEWVDEEHRRSGLSWYYVRVLQETARSPGAARSACISPRPRWRSEAVVRQDATTRSSQKSNGATVIEELGQDVVCDLRPGGIRTPHDLQPGRGRDEDCRRGRSFASALHRGHLLLEPFDQAAIDRAVPELGQSDIVWSWRRPSVRSNGAIGWPLAWDPVQGSHRLATEGTGKLTSRSRL